MGRLLITLIITSIIVLPAPTQSTPQPKLISLSSSIVPRGTSVIIEYDAYRGEEGLNITFSNGEVLAATLVSTNEDTARYRLIYTVQHTVSFRAYSYSGYIRTSEGYVDSNEYTGHWIREVGTPTPVIAGHNASLDLINTGEWTVTLGQTVAINVTIRGYTDSPIPSVVLLTAFYEAVTGVNEKIPAVLLDSTTEGSEVMYTFGVVYTLRTRYVYLTLNSSYGFMGQTETSIVPEYQKINNGFNYSVQKHGRYNDTHTFATGEFLNYTLMVENEANVSFSFKVTENYSSDVEIPLEVSRTVDGSLVIYGITSAVSDGMYFVVSLTDELINSTEVIAQYGISVTNGSSYLRFSNPIVTSGSSKIIDYTVINPVDRVKILNITLYAKDWNRTLLVDETMVQVDMKTPGDQNAYFLVLNSEGIVHNQSLLLIWDVTPPNGSISVSVSNPSDLVLGAHELGSNNSFIDTIDIGYRGLKERVFENGSSLNSEIINMEKSYGLVRSVELLYRGDSPTGNITLTIVDMAGNTYETWFEVTDGGDQGVTTVLLISSGSVIIIVTSVILWRRFMKRSS